MAISETVTSEPAAVEPVAPAAAGSAPARILVDIRDTTLSADECLAAVADPGAGGTTLFLGAVRDDDGGRSVERLSYSAHPSALDVLRGLAQEVAASIPVVAVAAVHRVGELEIGDIAVIVAVSAVHRGEAFEAGRLLIDRLKHEVPIWKHQFFADGTSEWVAAC